MKKTIWAVLCLCSMLGGTVASAQFQPVLKADIPFDFMIGKTRMPAGQYTIESGSTADTLWFRSKDSKAVRMANTLPARGGNANGKAGLVFNRYGKDTFLTQVWPRDGVNGRRIPKSSLEMELAKIAGAVTGAAVAVSAQ